MVKTTAFKTTVPASSDWVSGPKAQRPCASGVRPALLAAGVRMCCSTHVDVRLGRVCCHCPLHGAQVVRLGSDHLYTGSHLTSLGPTSAGGLKLVNGSAADLTGQSQDSLGINPF